MQNHSHVIETESAILHYQLHVCHQYYLSGILWDTASLQAKFFEAFWLQLVPLQIMVYQKGIFFHRWNGNDNFFNNLGLRTFQIEQKAYPNPKHAVVRDQIQFKKFFDACLCFRHYYSDEILTDLSDHPYDKNHPELGAQDKPAIM